MRSALAHHDSFDRRTTLQASLARALIYPEIILKVSSAVDPVDASAIALDPFKQHTPDRL